MNTVLKSLRKLQKGQGGFTLIELLVVVAILGVIAAVVILNVGGFIGRGTEESANTEVHQVQTAIVSCMTESACNITAGSIGPGTTTGPATYLLNPGALQATYTYNITSGEILTGTPTATTSKWLDCTFNITNKMWNCP